jgi:hypothetical protein
VASNSCPALKSHPYCQFIFKPGDSGHHPATQSSLLQILAFSNIPRLKFRNATYTYSNSAAQYEVDVQLEKTFTRLLLQVSRDWDYFKMKIDAKSYTYQVIDG